MEPLRHTPAGLPLLNFKLVHKSLQVEGGYRRQVECEVSCIALAVLIQQRTQLDTIIHFTTRDRNLMALQSELLGAHALGRHQETANNTVAPAGKVRSELLELKVSATPSNLSVRRASMVSRMASTRRPFSGRRKRDSSQNVAVK